MTPISSTLGAEVGVVQDLSAVGSSLAKYLLKDGVVKDTLSTQQHGAPQASDILSITSFYCQVYATDGRQHQHIKARVSREGFLYC